MERSGGLGEVGDTTVTEEVLRGMMMWAGLDFGFVLGVGVVWGITFVSSSEGVTVRHTACMGMVTMVSGGIQNSADFMLQLEVDAESKDDMEDEAECVKIRPSRRRAFNGRGVPPTALVGELTPIGSRTAKDWAVDGGVYVVLSCGHQQELSLDLTVRGAETGGEGRGRMVTKQNKQVEGTEHGRQHSLSRWQDNRLMSVHEQLQCDTMVSRVTTFHCSSVRHNLDTKSVQSQLSDGARRAHDAEVTIFEFSASTPVENASLVQVLSRMNTSGVTDNTTGAAEQAWIREANL